MAVVPGTPVLTETFDGVPGGSNLALPAQELDNTQARLLVDYLVDRPGVTRQRGPVTGVLGVAPLTRMGTGIMATLNPQGQTRFAVLDGDAGSGFFSVLSTDQATWYELAWPYGLPTDPAGGNPYRIVDAKPAQSGGLLIGVSSDYGAMAPQQGIAYWYGGNLPNYTVTVSATRGSTAVTGTGFTANVVPGMFLFANTDDPYTNAYLGIVLQVNSNTSLTLMKASPYTATAKSGTFQSIRGIAPRVTTGEITTATDSTTVTGGETKFLSQGVNNGIWQLYRQSDGAFIGKVSSVASEISLTLTANAAVALAGEAYVAIRADADFSIINTASTQKVGFLNATYANLQWFANRGSSFDATARIWFSDADDFEALDLSSFDGNWLDITSSSSVNEPIRSIAPAYNGLVIHKETETFIIGGSSPSSFEVRKLEDDGALSGMSVQQYGGGVIWAGREGIHFYDGIQTTNLVQLTLGDVWKNTVRTLDPTKYRMWSMINHDHYMLFLENVQPTFTIVKGNLSVTPSQFTVIINMITRAVTFAENVDIRGAIVLPASAGKQTWYLVNGRQAGDVSDHAFIADGEKLFNSTGLDPITCIGNTPGPSVYMESKKFDAGDGMRLKNWKQVSMDYLSSGGDLQIDIVLGLNNVGQTMSTTFPASVPTWTSLRTTISTWTNLKQQYPTWSDVVQSVFKPGRVRMHKKSQFMSFRIYGVDSVTKAPLNLKDAQIGPYSVAYKLMRPGRV